ncbi:MAG: hypothetical protein CO093_08800 [Alphaproteobacteria bacterium CG_4_9_14_3_um_filter_47_13]|nr:MAG: hypothetical protein CO093_08800 [Alphaproteobacteria bacterium CG_4_9_14_3_um_filter_47_13]
MSDIELDEISPKNIEIFVRQISGNIDLPLAQGVQHEGLNRQFGEFEDLPEPVQNIIEEIRAADSIAEKAAIAHNFSLTYIKPEMQFGGRLGQERNVSFSELAKDPRGDCDDYAKFNAGLLLYGGVDPRNIFRMQGMMKYESGLGTIQSGHAFVVVQDENEYVLLDNNLADTPIITPDNPVVHSNLFTNGINVPNLPADQMETTAEIVFLSSAIDGRGTPFENEAALAQLTDYMTTFIQTMEDNLPKTSKSLNDSFGAATQGQGVNVPENVQENHYPSNPSEEVPAMNKTNTVPTPT